MGQSDQLFARFGSACPRGTVLFREGEPGHTMYVLQSGRVRISRAGRRESKTLAVFGPGEFFGEMAILNNKPRSATAEVIEDARVLVLDAKTFEAMVIGNAEIAVRLIQKLARRLDAADELIEILMHRDPKARVILGLAREASAVGRQEHDGSVLIPLTLDQFASQIGLLTEEVQGVVARLQRLGMVRRSEEGFLVTDVLRLHEFLEFVDARGLSGAP